MWTDDFDDCYVNCSLNAFGMDCSICESAVVFCCCLVNYFG